MEHTSRIGPRSRGANPAVDVVIAVIVALGAVGLSILLYLVG
jgi:hypothetical protein